MCGDDDDVIPASHLWRSFSECLFSVFGHVCYLSHWICFGVPDFSRGRCSMPQHSSAVFAGAVCHHHTTTYYWHHTSQGGDSMVENVPLKIVTVTVFLSQFSSGSPLTRLLLLLIFCNHMFNKSVQCTLHTAFFPSLKTIPVHSASLLFKGLYYWNSQISHFIDQFISFLPCRYVYHNNKSIEEKSGFCNPSQ